MNYIHIGGLRGDLLRGAMPSNALMLALPIADHKVISFIVNLTLSRSCHTISSCKLNNIDLCSGIDNLTLTENLSTTDELVSPLCHLVHP